MEVETEKRNDILKRLELSLELESEINPNFSDVKKQLAEQFSKPEENINVSSIKGSFGRNSFLIKAVIYDSKEDLEIIKNLEMSKKQRKEADDAAKKAKEEGEKAVEEAEEEAEEKPEEASEENATDELSEEKLAEKVDSAPVEEKEPVEEAEEKPSEAPAEDKPEEEAKTISEEKQKEEESKE